MDHLLEGTEIEKSLFQLPKSYYVILSLKYDNGYTYKEIASILDITEEIFKTEFANISYFESLEQLEIMLADYVNWFNNIRIHSTLGYLSPKEYKLHNLKKLSRLVLTIHGSICRMTNKELI